MLITGRFAGSGVKGPGQHSGHVGVDRRLGRLERESRDRARGIAADTRKRPESVDLRRNSPVQLGDHPAGQSMKVGGPPIVSKTLPALPHHPRGGGGEGVDVRVLVEEAGVEALDPADLGLLEHELRNEDPVRVAGPAPGQVATVLPEPGHDEATERR